MSLAGKDQVISVASLWIETVAPGNNLPVQPDGHILGIKLGTNWWLARALIVFTARQLTEKEGKINPNEAQNCYEHFPLYVKRNKHLPIQQADLVSILKTNKFYPLYLYTARPQWFFFSEINHHVFLHLFQPHMTIIHSPVLLIGPRIHFPNAV